MRRRFFSMRNVPLAILGLLLAFAGLLAVDDHFGSTTYDEDCLDLNSGQVRTRSYVRGHLRSEKITDTGFSKLMRQAGFVPDSVERDWQEANLRSYRPVFLYRRTTLHTEYGKALHRLDELAEMWELQRTPSAARVSQGKEALAILKTGSVPDIRQDRNSGMISITPPP